MLKARPKTTLETPEWDDGRLATVCASNLEMFESQDGCDITITVRGPGDKQDTKIGAHRFVLCSRSPVLYRQLWGAKAGTEKKLTENDIPAEAFRELLRYLYSEQVKLTLGNALQVLQGARKYLVTPLTFVCLDFLEQRITVDDVCSMLEQALAMSEHVLADRCLKYVEKHTSQVFRSSAFLNAPVNVLSCIVALETVDVTELELFQACVAWARARSAPPPADGAELRKYLEPILTKIRFPTMGQTDFAKYVVPLNILSESEALNVYKYFTCPEKPPKRFITVKRNQCIVANGTDNGTNISIYPNLNNASAPIPSAPVANVRSSKM